VCIKVIPTKAGGRDCSTIGASFCLSFFLCYLYLVYPAECPEVPCKLCEKLRACCDWQPYHNVFTTPNRVFPCNRDAFAVAERDTWDPIHKFSNMSKRSPNSTSPLTSPHLKHARMDDSPDESEPLTKEEVFQLLHSLIRSIQSIIPTAKDHIPQVYQQLRLQKKFFSNQVKNRTLATELEFEKKVASVNQEELLEIMREATESPLDHEALETLIYHSMCFTLRWIRP
jgi:hypothetical protein